MKRILMTGVTGAIGSMHLIELVNRGYEVTCIVRGESDSERFSRLAKIVGMNIASLVCIVNGDITKSIAGLSEFDINVLKGKIDIIIHHAGSIKFDRAYQEEIMATNVGGTANMLALAEVLGVKNFCYDSTAYALNSVPRNPYEESKQIAEAMVLDWRGGETMVWRPSIVIGRKSDGVTHGFNGYYGFFTGFFFLKSMLSQKWDNENHEACLAQGFEFDEFGALILHHPLYVDYSRISTLNLIPVDWAVSVMTDLLQSAKWGTAYNIVNEHPPQVAWVIERSMSILGIQGVKCLSAHNIVLPPAGFWQMTQQRINRHLERFWHYINHEISFVSDASTAAPIVDQAMLQTMLDYAVKENFGKKKKT